MYWLFFCKSKTFNAHCRFEMARKGNPPGPGFFLWFWLLSKLYIPSTLNIDQYTVAHTIDCDLIVCAVKC